MIAVPFRNHAAAAVFCPQFLAQYCAVDKDGSRRTAWTNPCVAKRDGLRVLHMGSCKGGH
jgi:hypothetical protein